MYKKVQTHRDLLNTSKIEIYFTRWSAIPVHFQLVLVKEHFPTTPVWGLSIVLSDMTAVAYP